MQLSKKFKKVGINLLVKQLTFIDFFAGIGGFHSGMELAGHKCVGYVEWDKFARQSYEAIYNTKGLYTANDISKIENGGVLPQADVWCFGSPCTNISLAGNREGIHGEASSMFFEVMRLLKDREEVRKPAYLFMENVKNLLSSNGGRDFAEVLLQMDKAGYDVEWQVCNSKEVVPQNRERIFVIGHKRGRTTRRVFPLDIKPYATKYRILSDVLEENVDEKYYLSDDKVKQLVINAQKDNKKKTTKSTVNVVGSTKQDWQTTIGMREQVFGNGKIGALTATDYKQPKRIAEKNGKIVERAEEVKQIGNTVNTDSFGGNPQRGRVYSDEGISPTLNTMQGGGLEPKILVKNIDNQHIDDAKRVINPLKGKSGKSWQFEQQIYDKHGITRTVKANGGSGNIPKVIEDEEVYPCLTPDRINKRQNGRRFKENEDPMFTVTAADRHGVAIKRVFGSTQKHASITNGSYSPALTSAMGMGGGHIPMAELTAKKQFGRLGKQAVETFNEHQKKVQPGDCIEPYNKRIHHEKTPTVTTRPEGLKTAILPITQELRIRKLTPLECWRLQGFEDVQFQKAKDDGVSNSQLYKQAGNAVTVPVIHAIADQFEIKD